MAKPKTKKKSTKKKGAQRPRATRYLRGGLGLLLLFSVLGVAGSFYMRQKVVAQLKAKAAESFAVVMSRPFKITPGLDIKAAKVLERIKRLRYQPVSGEPKRPGQYSYSDGRMRIYLRGIDAGPNKSESAIAELIVGSNQKIEQILDGKFRQPIGEAWLEPELLSLLGQEARRATTAKSLDGFGKTLVDAVISIEDERFRYHLGVDPWAILRAAVVNFQSGRIVQGGSTITQQLAKNLFLAPERTLVRKLREAFSAILIETAFSKDEILELYLNEVFLGQEGSVAIHGFGEAAMSFFGKDVSQLDLSETATLAGIIKAPSYYSPRRHPQRAAKRREIVLEKMASLGLVDQKKLSQAKKAKLEIRESQRSVRVAPYFIDYIRNLIGSSLDSLELERSPLQLNSGLDLEYQRCAQQAVRGGLSTLEKNNSRLKRKSSPLEAALLAVVPATGEIIAWVGGREYRKNQFDHVSMAKRQPGSVFKPFVYLTALDPNLNSYRAARTTSLLIDEPIELEITGSEPWRPQNYDEKFRGDVTVREALVRSLNIPTVQLAMKVGVGRIADTAQLLGFREALPRVPALALGAAEVSLLDLARAYSVIANEGIATELRPILSVTRAGDGKVLYQSELRERQLLAPQPVFVLTDILRTVVDRGTGASVRRLGFQRQAAGKTGTSNDARDAWFAGYTPRTLAIVWVGFDDNRPIGLTGGQAAVPIWTSFMKCISGMEPDLNFIPPPGVLYREIDRGTGLIASANCPKSAVVREIFVQGNEPKTVCPRHSGNQGGYDGYDEDFGPDRLRASLKKKSKAGKKKKSILDQIFGDLFN